MKLNAGIVTEKMVESKSFYVDILGFGVTFENEFYLLLHTPDRSAELSFLSAHHATQQPLFHPPFLGQGVYLTIEVEDVGVVYKSLLSKGVEVKVDLRTEFWGDRHFTIQDPNGVAIDIVTYTPQS